MARLTVILNGRKEDRGFVQEGYESALAARDELGLELEIVEHTERDPNLLQDRVELAAGNSAGVIVHGSHADAPIEVVAPRFPDCMFLSTGGYVTGKNVWSYPVRHYEAAYLAGILAARMTKSGTVGHLSGVPISPGKRGRAAFVDGVLATDETVKVVTGFCGDQDNPELAKHWTNAEARAGADIIFTMLNFGRSGAIEACRANGIKQIGNIRDWCIEEPDVFIGSVAARHGWSVRNWISDLLAGRLESGVNRNAGLEEPGAVKLIVCNSVPAEICKEIEQMGEQIIKRRCIIADTYSGPEFRPDQLAE